MYARKSIYEYYNTIIVYTLHFKLYFIIVQCFSIYNTNYGMGGGGEIIFQSPGIACDKPNKNKTKGENKGFAGETFL